MDGEAQESFAALSDQPLPAGVALAAWCPTMDLLAVAFADGRLAVHRLNWQRLWLVTPYAAPTALAWTSGGESLAIGCANGTVSLLAAETGDIWLEDHCSDSGAVSALTWVEEHDLEAGVAAVPQLALQGRLRRFCLPPTNSTNRLSAQACPIKEKGGWPVLPAKLTLLGIAYEFGGIRVCTATLFELLNLAPSQVAAMTVSGAGAPAAHISQVAISRGLSHMLTLQRSEDGEHLAIYSTAGLAEAKAQLRYQANLSSEVLCCLEGAQAALAAADREWQGATGAVAERMGALQGLLEDNLADSTPAVELQRLLASGALSPSLHQFLTSMLGEAGLRRLARQVDSGLTEAALALGAGLAPSARAAALQLGDVSGLAHPPCALPACGLQAAELQRARGLAAQLLVRCEQARLAITAAAGDYRRLFAWLLRCTRRLDEDGDDAVDESGGPPADALALADFLDDQFQDDRIALELRAPAETTGQDNLPCIGGAACELLQLAGLATAPPKTPLWGLAQQLQQAARAALCGVSAALSPTVRPLLALRLRSAEQLPPPAAQQQRQQSEQTLPQQPARLQLAQIPADGDADGGRLWVSWPGAARPRGGGEPSPHLCILRVSLPSNGDADQEPSVEAAAVRLPPGRAALDSAFYKAGQLALLLAPQQQAAADSGAAAAVGGAQNGSLALLSLEELELAAVPPQQQQAPADILQECVSSGAVVSVDDTGCRQRAVPYADVEPPLAVSGPRGVAAVLTRLPRAVLYDVEGEDEAEEDEEEEEEDARRKEENDVEEGGGGDDSMNESEEY